MRLSDGTALWAASTGSGPPLVLLHGGPGLWDYLAALAALLDDRVTAIRFDQRGCARSGGNDGPFTIAQAVDDLDQLRAAFGAERWAVLGHSWGAELAVHYAARHPRRVATVLYVGGVGAGDGYLDGYLAERDRRLGAHRERWDELRQRARTPAEDREYCLLQWRPDFSPSGDPQRHAEALWDTRPPGVSVSARANRELWADRSRVDLLAEARQVRSPVRMVQGADDPRPWRATDSLLEAVPDARRTVLDGAGHAPWTERPDDSRALVLEALDEADW